MSNHPAPAALAAYVLGHHDEIDRAEIESHVQGCEDCMDEVGREARLELLLAAAAREDTFVAVLPLRARRRWPSVAAAAVALAHCARVGAALRRRRPVQRGDVREPEAADVRASQHSRRSRRAGRRVLHTRQQQLQPAAGS